MLNFENVLSGAEFLEIYADKKFYKLTNYLEKHHNMWFSDGLNIDPIEFNPNGECSPGGIYFTEYDNIAKWLTYGGDQMCWIREVYIPFDAKVYIERNKFKIDKIFLKPRVLIDQFEAWANYDFCLQAIQQNFNAYVYIKCNQNNEIYKDAISVDASILRLIRNQNKELCELAVKKEGCVLKYVHKQTDTICELAVKQDGFALQYVHDINYKLCELAVQANGLALQFIHVRTYEQKHQLEKLAVQSNGLALQYVRTQTPELCELAITQNGKAIQYIYKQTPELCELAVHSNGLALQYVDYEFKTYEICLTAVKQNGLALQYVPTYFLNDSWWSALFFNMKIEKICLAAVKQNGLSLKYVRVQTKKIRMEAAKQKLKF